MNVYLATARRVTKSAVYETYYLYLDQDLPEPSLSAKTFFRFEVSMVCAENPHENLDSLTAKWKAEPLYKSGIGFRSTFQSGFFGLQSRTRFAKSGF